MSPLFALMSCLGYLSVLSVCPTICLFCLSVCMSVCQIRTYVIRMYVRTFMGT